MLILAKTPGGVFSGLFAPKGGSLITKTIEQTERYIAMVEECKAIMTEAVFNSRWALVEGYWLLGKRIDLDFLIYNYKTRRIMFVEVKTRNAEMKTWQRMIFKQLDKWIKKGIDEDWTYLGYHLIQFENTCFEDGKAYYDHIEKTKTK